MTTRLYDGLIVTRHHTKDKGDIAVAEAVADLTRRGALVLLPMTEHAPFDLVAFLDDRFFRVQVKYRTSRNGSVTVVFRSTWADRHGVHERPMSKAEVDVILIYCPDTNRCYYLDPGEHGREVSLRIGPSRNGQRIGVHSADDHLVMPPLSVRGIRPGEAPFPELDSDG